MHQKDVHEIVLPRLSDASATESHLRATSLSLQLDLIIKMDPLALRGALQDSNTDALQEMEEDLNQIAPNDEQRQEDGAIDQGDEQR